MQKPTKAFAEMVFELADRLEAVLREMYSDGAIFVSPDSLRAAARGIGKNAEAGQVIGQTPQLPGRFEPLHPITMYQAQCTSCGAIVDDYGDYSCMADDAVVSYVRESLGWFEVTRRELSPTPGMPTRVIVHTVELLCPECQRCEVCGALAPAEIDEHLVCVDHKAHAFADDFAALPHVPVTPNN
ncbi:hypothetical protein [Mycobacteroides abscessus]|uniref:hypothetical protein n=1 Tax=Mycobacteroides abscessus TaxID=36809 RepID=UPI0009A7EC3B|nr:hypothetical protein [Mycobacteroides abscessus]SLC01141.1 Uncharacterised protein [Mycobacteroides abscessus subsp. abscessus]SLG09084.1 Uncharacterised protein [Mycobacteroides abscessus subsp. abscessus]